MINTSTYGITCESKVMSVNFRPRRLMKKVWSEVVVVVTILGLLNYLLFDIKKLNKELAEEVALSHRDIKLNSTQRQICYHKLEIKERSLAVKVRCLSDQVESADEGFLENSIDWDPGLAGECQ